MTSASGYMESGESRALRSINTESYDYRDQAKLISKLTGDVSYMAQYMRTMQRGIDSANENFIQQFNNLLKEIFTVLGGGGNTGFDFGDLRYVLQAIGALFGFDTQTGIAAIFPINLFDAAWHFISTYVIPIDNFGEFVDNIIDNLFATLLDLFGEIPIIGQAVQQFVVWASQIRDFINTLTTVFVSWTKPIADGVINTVNWVVETFFAWTEPIATAILNNVAYLWGLFQTWTAPFVTGLTEAVAWLSDLFVGWTEPIVLGITNAVAWFTQEFANWGAGVATFIKNTVDFLSDLFGDWTNAFVTSITTAINFVSSAFGNWSAEVAEFIRNTVNFLDDLFGDWTAGFVQLIKDVTAAVQEIVDWFVGGVGQAISNLFPWAKKLPQMQIVLGQEVIKTANVPTIDATKVSGTLSDTQIPNLSTDKLTSGRIPGGRIALNTLDDTHITTTGLTGTALAAGAVTSAKIADGNITAAKVADGNITVAKIADGNITAAKIADGNITTAKIGSNAVNTSHITLNGLTSAALASESVINAKLGPLAVTEAKIQANAVTSGKVSNLDASSLTSGTLDATRIGALAITGGKIADLAITGGKVADLTIGGGKIADTTLTGGKLADLTVTGAKIANTTVTSGKVSNLDGSNITSGTIAAARLPSGLGAVGSGIMLERTSAAAQHVTSNVGQTTPTYLPYGFYDSVSNFTTADISVLNIGTYLALKVANPGWYMAEIGFQLRGGVDLANFTFHWGFTPLIGKSSGNTLAGSAYRVGTTAICVVDSNLTAINSWTGDVAQASFIMYLTNNDTIFPGYYITREGTTNAGSFVRTGNFVGSNGNYFSMSLLNRSLA